MSSPLAIAPRAHAGGGADDALRQKLHAAAVQFEAVFVQQLLSQSTHEPIDSDPLLGASPASGMFRDLLHGGLSERASGGLGIAAIVERELALRAGLTSASTAPAPALPATLPSLATPTLPTSVAGDPP